MVQLRTHGETLTKIEIPHKAVRKRMVPQGGPVTWQARHSKVKHECVSKFRVFSDGEPPCIRHANEYEQSLRSRNGLDRFRGCTEARASKVTEPTHPLTVSQSVTEVTSPSSNLNDDNEDISNDGLG